MDNIPATIADNLNLKTFFDLDLLIVINNKMKTGFVGQ